MPESQTFLSNAFNLTNKPAFPILSPSTTKYKKEEMMITEIERKIRFIAESRNDTPEKIQKILNSLLKYITNEKIIMSLSCSSLIKYLELLLQREQDLNLQCNCEDYFNFFKYRLAHLHLRNMEYQKAYDVFLSIGEDFYDNPIVRIYVLVCLRLLKRNRLFDRELKKYLDEYSSLYIDDIEQRPTWSGIEVQRALFNYLELVVYLTRTDYRMLSGLLADRSLLTRSDIVIITREPESRIRRIKEMISGDIKAYPVSSYHVYINKLSHTQIPHLQPQEKKLFELLTMSKFEPITNDVISARLRRFGTADRLNSGPEIAPIVSSLRRKISEADRGAPREPILNDEGAYYLSDDLAYCVISDNPDLLYSCCEP